MRVAHVHVQQDGGEDEFKAEQKDGDEEEFKAEYGRIRNLCLYPVHLIALVRLELEGADDELADDAALGLVPA